ncbi:MAG: ribosomal protein S18-alanine N-acetyltransferase [Deltaproteobacteria bacterium]|nr:ribosomal protein S18-alanine N-acetyltransferase [Deltaproteobacteria bacterium]
MIIERATTDDLDAIDEIEQHSFKVPWPRATFEGELGREWARIDVVRDPHVIAFNNYWLVAGELHILAIATHPDRRRAGIAGLLLAHAMDAARAVGATLATLEVRKGNTPAIALYQRAGFKTVHTRQRYYQDDGEDALVMLCDLTPAT